MCGVELFSYFPNLFGCQFDEPYASLVTTSRMQQCFNVHIDIYHEFVSLFYCCVLLEIKLNTTIYRCSRLSLGMDDNKVHPNQILLVYLPTMLIKPF